MLGLGCGWLYCLSGHRIARLRPKVLLESPRHCCYGQSIGIAEFPADRPL
jgi:hypothetical protein